jgi:histone deacetylase 1/2
MTAHPLHLHDILVSPHIIKNLISVRRFTIDNQCSVEFDPFGLSVKDLATRNVIVRCNSSGELYSFQPPTTHPRTFAAITSPPVLWHRRLSHLGHESLSHLAPSLHSACNKSELETLCHACQLGRHVRLPFTQSNTRALKNFDLIHCDLWTSPIASVTGYKYYLIILDDCSHYSWTFPLRLKSDTFPTLSNFFSYVNTQFGTSIKTVQCDNGREFDNSTTRFFLLTHGATIRMSCPHTSPQNGHAERIIRSTNNIMCSLMFQASILGSYWVEALHTATYLLNCHPTKTLDFSYSILCSIWL